MTRLARSLLLLVVAVPVQAAGILWLHHSAAPVAVPGGASSFFLDDQEPPALQPIVVQALTVADTATASFPVFTSIPFASDVALEAFVGSSVG